MKNTVYFLLLFMVINSCSFAKQKRTNELIRKMKGMDIISFYPIEFGVRGDIDVYTYHFSDTLNYIWTYDNKLKEFDFKRHPEFNRFRNEVEDYEMFASEVRANIQALDVVSISQSPWIGKLIKFRISSAEFVCYVNPDFEFDTPAKQQWKHELESGEELKPNWIYVDTNSMD